MVTPGGQCVINISWNIVNGDDGFVKYKYKLVHKYYKIKKNAMMRELKWYY